MNPPQIYIWWTSSQMALVVKTRLPMQEIRDAGLVSGSGRSPEGRHGNPLQYPCLENPTDRGTWQAIVYRVVKSWTQLKQLSTCKLFKSFAYFSTWVIFSLLFYRRPLYFLDTLFVGYVYFKGYFPSCGLFFHFLLVCFDEKVLILMWHK